MTFYDPSSLKWAETLVDNYRAIRAEFQNLQDAVLIETDGDEIYDSGWDVFGLHYDGEPMLDNCDICPVTTSLIREVPGLRSAGFDILRPESLVLEHEGDRGHLRFSLGLIVPVGAAVMVGDTVAPWIEGGCMIWDADEQSEAFNSHEKISRISLLVDFEPDSPMAQVEPVPI